MVEDRFRIAESEVSRISQCITHYQVLGVAMAAKDTDIRKQYKRLALILHPDKAPDVQGAEDAFKRVNEAFRILKDPVARIQYNLKASVQMARPTPMQTQEFPFAPPTTAFPQYPSSGLNFNNPSHSYGSYTRTYYTPPGYQQRPAPFTYGSTTSQYPPFYSTAQYAPQTQTQPQAPQPQQQFPAGVRPTAASTRVPPRSQRAGACAEPVYPSTAKTKKNVKISSKKKQKSNVNRESKGETLREMIWRFTQREVGGRPSSSNATATATTTTTTTTNKKTTKSSTNSSPSRSASHSSKHHASPARSSVRKYSLPKKKKKARFSPIVIDDDDEDDEDDEDDDYFAKEDEDYVYSSQDSRAGVANQKQPRIVLDDDDNDGDHLVEDLNNLHNDRTNDEDDDDIRVIRDVRGTPPGSSANLPNLGIHINSHDKLDKLPLFNDNMGFGPGNMGPFSRQGNRVPLGQDSGETSPQFILISDSDDSDDDT